MAIANKTDLWKLASIRMGQEYTRTILDATNPTTPLELTFNLIYDQIRLDLLNRIEPMFARRTQALKAAPTVDHQGQTHEWTQLWDYVYAPPTDMIKFIGFWDEIAAAKLQSDYEMLSLPIAYGEYDATNIVGYLASPVIGSDSELLPTYMYRNFMRGFFFDDSNEKHWIIDVPDSSALDTFAFKNENPVITLTSGLNYTSGGGWTVNFQPGDLAGVYDITAGKAITFEVAYGSPYVDEPSVVWTNHIVTDKGDASAVYLVDVTDPISWPIQFQNAVIVEMAYQASIVHAKSARLIQALEKEAFKAASLAVTSLAEPIGYVDGGGPARAMRARR